jgi:hypothetical protein
MVRWGVMLVAGLGLFWMAGVLHPLAATTPPELTHALEGLNQVARDAYAANRQAALARTDPVVIVEGDNLVLWQHGEREEVRVIPPRYQQLKAIAHVPLGIYSLLASAGSGPLPGDRYVQLRRFRERIRTVRALVGQDWPDPASLSRQLEILDGGTAYLDRVLAAGRAPAEELEAYCRRTAPLVLANAAEAARLQIDAYRRQVSRWRRQLSPAEWGRLQVVVIGSQMPRRGNLAVQYFARLVGQKGEGPRLTYAEALWEEPLALRLLGTRLVDTEIGRVFFADPQRMHRDLLADAAAEYLRTLTPDRDAPR